MIRTSRTRRLAPRCRPLFAPLRPPSWPPAAAPSPAPERSTRQSSRRPIHPTDPLDQARAAVAPFLRRIRLHESAPARPRPPNTNTNTTQKGNTMFQLIHPEYQLANIRERHARLRRQAEYSRQFRELEAARPLPLATTKAVATAPGTFGDHDSDVTPAARPQPRDGTGTRHRIGLPRCGEVGRSGRQERRRRRRRRGDAARRCPPCRWTASS